VYIRYISFDTACGARLKKKKVKHGYSCLHLHINDKQSTPEIIAFRALFLKISSFHTYWRAAAPSHCTRKSIVSGACFQIWAGLYPWMSSRMYWQAIILVFSDITTQVGSHFRRFVTLNGVGGCTQLYVSCCQTLC